MELFDKVIDFLGDSITEGVGVEDVEHCRFDNVLRREYGLAVAYNYGIGGTRIAHQSIPSEKPRYDLCFCGRAYDISPEADIIVVYGGVNDYIHGDAYFGTPEDTTPATFCGGVNFLMDLLTERYVGKTIVFLTPARMCLRGVSDETVSARPMKKPDAKTLVHYADVIKAAAEKRGIPVLDLYRELPIDPNIPEHAQKYTTDGLHFNDAGHAVLAKTLADFLLSLK